MGPCRSFISSLTIQSCMLFTCLWYTHHLTARILNVVEGKLEQPHVSLLGGLPYQLKQVKCPMSAFMVSVVVSLPVTRNFAYIASMIKRWALYMVIRQNYRKWKLVAVCLKKGFLRNSTVKENLQVCALPLVSNLSRNKQVERHALALD